MTISSVNLRTSDLYYICQMVDAVSADPFPWMRNIEEFAGDMACRRFLSPFPKWTPFHDFIGFVILSVAHEDLIVDEEDFLVPRSDPVEMARRGRTPWIDTLLASNGFNSSFRRYVADGGEASLYDYIGELGLAGPLDDLLQAVARQVFHVLFQNRKVLRNFGEMIAQYVSNNGAELYPEMFTNRGVLRRSNPPSWAKNAVFHRDKGCCVFCGTDLTKLVNLREKLHYDHIIPLVAGGTNDVTNLQLLCSDCNLKKGGKSVPTSFRVDEWYSFEQVVG